MAVWKRRDTGKWVCHFRHNGRRHLPTLKLARTKKLSAPLVSIPDDRQPEIISQLLGVTLSVMHKYLSSLALA